MTFFLVATGLCVLLDLWITSKRIQKFGPKVELNPLIRKAAEFGGAELAVVALAWWNVGILSLIALFQLETMLHVLFGMKLGLALLQLKSLQL